jgi:hypothetical protein
VRVWSPVGGLPPRGLSYMLRKTGLNLARNKLLLQLMLVNAYLGRGAFSEIGGLTTC